MSDKKCGGCALWFRDGQGRPLVNGAIDMSQPVRGFCRARPPMQQVGMNQQTNQLMFSVPVYPLLDEQFPACGLYKEKE